MEFKLTAKENYKRMLNREKPERMPLFTDTQLVNPNIIPDNVARAFVFEKNMITEEQFGGKDMYGINWVYVPTVGGSMEDPDEPHLLEEIEDWKDNITFPDVDSWDWEGCAERNKGYYNPDLYSVSWIFTGMFERLIAFMGFEGAAMALIDDDVEDDLHELFDKIADTHIKVIGNLKKYFDIDGVYFHDDWGSQRAPFFSASACREKVMPHIKRIVDFCHENGMTFEFHSCGMNELLVPVMKEMGIDVWCGQPMNDKYKVREEAGDVFCTGITFENVTEDANVTPEQKVENIKKAVDEMLEKVKGDVVAKPMYVQDVPFNMDLTKYVAEKSAEVYATI